MAPSKKELNNLPPRLKRIYDELLENKVDVVEDYILRGRRLEVFFEELDYAFHPHVHERFMPSYAAAVVTDSQEGSIEIADEHTVQRLRIFCDGYGSLLIRCENGKAKVVHLDISTEIRCLQTDFVPKFPIIRRNREGTVTIFARSNIFVCDKGAWFSKTYGVTLGEALQTIAPMANRKTLVAASVFCVHVLSNQNIGATLVVWVDGKSAPDSVSRSNCDPVIHPQLNLKADNFPAIASAMSQLDRAVIFDYEGNLLEINSELQPSVCSREIIHQNRGTRHTSAKRYSFDQARCVVFTVSVDGPISVFSDGQLVTETGFFARHSAVGRMGYSYQSISTMIAAWSANREIVCSKCGKTVEMEIVTVAGYREDETAICPICGNSLLKARCYTIHERIKKTFS